jgi:hypothetical protein
LERYRSHPNIIDIIQAWPDGSEAAPLTLGQMISARKISANQAAEAMGFVFNYEATIVNTRFGSLNKSAKQQQLEKYSALNETGPYISFGTIKSWDAHHSETIKAQLFQLRTDCMHNKIPINGSYRQQCMPDNPMAEVLGIETPIGADRSVIKIYELNTENEINYL